MSGMDAVVARQAGTPRAALRRLVVPRQAVAIGALVLAGALLLVLTWGTWGDPSRDTGYDMLAASRTAGGQLPYVDYVYYYGPLAPLLLGGIYALAGAGIGPAVALGLVVAGAIVALTYRLARAFVVPAGAALAAALTLSAVLSSGNNSYVLPHASSAPLAIALALGGLLALAGYTREGGTLKLAGAGATFGLLALTRPEFLAAFACAAGAWLLARAVSRGRPVMREAAVLLAPALLIPAAVYGALLTQVGARDLITGNLFPSGSSRAAYGSVLELSAPLTLGSFATLAGYLALYAALVAGMMIVARAITHGGTRGRAAAAVAVGFAVAFVMVLAARPEAIRHGLQDAYGWIPVGAVLAVALLAWRVWRGRARPDGRREVEIALAVFLAVLAAKTYAAFFPHPNALHSQSAVYALPFAAVFLAWLHVHALPRGDRTTRMLGVGWLALLAVAGIVLTARDARDETITLRAAHGTLTTTPANGAAYAGAMQWIERETATGDPVLLAPQMTWMYVATGRTNPLTHLSLLPGALGGPADERRAIAQMHGVRLAIVDRHVYREYGSTGAFGSGHDRTVGAWLRNQFVHVATLRGGAEADIAPRVLDVYLRRPS